MKIKEQQGIGANRKKKNRRTRMKRISLLITRSADTSYKNETKWIRRSCICNKFINCNR